MAQLLATCLGCSRYVLVHYRWNGDGNPRLVEECIVSRVLQCPACGARVAFFAPFHSWAFSVTMIDGVCRPHSRRPLRWRLADGWARLALLEASPLALPDVATPLLRLQLLWPVTLWCLYRLGTL